MKKTLLILTILLFGCTLETEYQDGVCRPTNALYIQQEITNVVRIVCRGREYSAFVKKGSILEEVKISSVNGVTIFADVPANEPLYVINYIPKRNSWSHSSVPKSEIHIHSIDDIAEFGFYRKYGKAQIIKENSFIVGEHNE